MACVDFVMFSLTAFELCATYCKMGKSVVAVDISECIKCQNILSHCPTFYLESSESEEFEPQLVKYTNDWARFLENFLEEGGMS